MLTAILGRAQCFPAWDLAIYGIAVAAGFRLFVVLYEDPALGLMFGAEYGEFRARVGRWLPRVWS